MPRITKSYVDKIPIPAPSPGGKTTQKFYRDSALPGFGLRVTSGGTKSYIVEKRIRGRVKRFTLAKHGVLTPDQARTLAQTKLGEIAKGGDPIAEKRAERIKGITLSEVFHDYIVAHRDLKASTIYDYRRSMNGPFKEWKTQPITSISKDRVERKYRALAERSPARANNAMRVLRALFNYARHKYEDGHGQPLVPVNPVDRLSETRAWLPEKRRRTIIQPTQLKAWYQATLQLSNETTRDYLHFLLFTGLRRSEAACLYWRDIDFDERWFVIPDTKNKRPHTLPLSSYLESLLKRRYENRINEFVFGNTSKKGHLSEPKNAVQRVGENSNVPFTLHDLRRTFITIAESLDIPSYALKQLLNHKNPNDVTEGYIVSNVNRLRVPMEKVSSYLVSACNMDNSNKIVDTQGRPMRTKVTAGV